MKELQKIVDTFDQTDFSTRKAALATVVRVQGSSYRRAGARMLITDDGRWTGAISGGCLEGDALRKSREVILQDKPRIVTYDTMDDQDASSLGVGLGCNGIIDVLIEPVSAQLSAENPIQIFKNFLKNRKREVLATVFTSTHKARIQAGERLILQSTNETLNLIQDRELSDLVRKDVKRIMKAGVSVTKTYQLEDTIAEVFLEVLHPAIELLIFGGGYDVGPVVKLAREIGWHVTVTDDCVAHVGPKRFPQANDVVYAPRESAVNFFTITQYTASVLMSHNYKYEIALLPDLLKAGVPYLGILGPRKRTEKMFAELQANGIEISDTDKQRIHSPIGLDIGAETPDEIALAIVSEIQARYTGRKAGFLKEKEGYIHQR